MNYFDFPPHKLVMHPIFMAGFDDVKQNREIQESCTLNKDNATLYHAGRQIALVSKAENYWEYSLIENEVKEAISSGFFC